MKRAECPYCHCSQLIAAVINGTSVCRYCRRWFKVCKKSADAPKTMLALELPQYARPSGIHAKRKRG